MNWSQRVRQLKSETYALYLAYKDPRTPWHARLWLALVLGYALSPIDLIPDFIPVLGYLDDLVLIPAGIIIAIKLLPAPVLADCRLKAQTEMASDKPQNRTAAIIIVAIWLGVAALLTVLVIRLLL